MLHLAHLVPNKQWRCSSRKSTGRLQEISKILALLPQVHSPFTLPVTYLHFMLTPQHLFYFKWSLTSIENTMVLVTTEVDLHCKFIHDSLWVIMFSFSDLDFYWPEMTFVPIQNQYWYCTHWVVWHPMYKIPPSFIVGVIVFELFSSAKLYCWG